jgi:hypothetical protein
MALIGSIEMNSNSINNYSHYNEAYEEVFTKNVPKTSDGVSFHKENPFDIINDPFTDLDNWTDGGFGTGSIVGNELRLQRGIFPGIQDVYATYQPSIPRFVHGTIQFDWRSLNAGTLELKISINGGSFNTEWSTTSTTGSANIDLESLGFSNENNFRVRLNYNANVSQNVYIDDFILSTYEISWTEQDDPIEPSNSQNIRLFLCPEFPNYISDLDTDNVSIWFNNDSSVVTSGTRVWSGQTSNNFTISIPSSGYESSDTVYYQIWINDDPASEYHTSSIKSFTVYDRAPPTISQIQVNATAYYNQDLKITCHVEDNENGVGLFEVSMYIKNGSEAFGGDIPIAHNVSGPLEGPADFEFIIPQIYLSARSNETLHYKIVAGDDSFQYANTGDRWEDVFDNDAPTASLYDDDAGTKPFEGPFEVESNRSLNINFTVTEPRSGVGLQDVRLFIKNGTSDPTSNADYDWVAYPKEPITLIGGIYNFVITTNNYTFGNKLYCFISATDLSDNNYTDYNTYRNYTIVDNLASVVTPASSNSESASYHLNTKVLSFTINETSGASGIKNSTLFYQIDDPGLGSPLNKFHIIGTYNNISSFDITDYTWKYGQVVYYQFVVFDNALNQYDSGILYFNVSDTVDPQSIEDANNTNGCMYGYWKTFNITVWDPDYDAQNISSGIYNVRLFWKLGGPPSESDDEVLGPAQPVTISKNMTTYLFNFTLLPDYSPISQTEIFYRFYIYDYAYIYDYVVGRPLAYSGSSFYLFDFAQNSSTINGPEPVISSSSFPYSFDLNFYSDIWYDINGTEYYNERIPWTKPYYKGFIIGEGIWNITFHILNNFTSFSFMVEIDLTPPSKIEEISIVIYGGRVVVINWDEPPLVDDQTVYKIYRSTDPNFKIGPDSLFDTIGVKEDRNIQDDSVVEGVTYYYIIVAVDRVGNVSPLSQVLVAGIPGNPVIMIILIVIIGAVAGSALFVLRKKAVAKKREELFSQVDLKSLELDDFESGDSGPEWSTIHTVPLIVDEGFQFVGEEKPLILEDYWNQKVGALISQATKYELEGDYGKALRLYLILDRLAKRTDNRLLSMSIMAKKEEIFRFLND